MTMTSKTSLYDIQELRIWTTTMLGLEYGVMDTASALIEMRACCFYSRYHDNTSMKGRRSDCCKDTYGFH